MVGPIEIEFDPMKDAKNRAERGLPFALIVLIFDGEVAEYEDTRRDYVEFRINVFGLVQGRLLAATYTMRGDTVRVVISLRKANEEEQRKWLR